MVSADAADCQGLLDRISTVIFDCDGVLWRGSRAIPGAAEAIAKLRQRGKRLFFITNNSTKDRRMLLKKFRAFGLDARLDEIIGTSYLLAAHLKGHPALAETEAAVYVIGREGIVNELELVGIPSYGGPVAIPLLTH